MCVFLLELVGMYRVHTVDVTGIRLKQCGQACISIGSGELWGSKRKSCVRQLLFSIDQFKAFCVLANIHGPFHC